MLNGADYGHAAFAGQTATGANNSGRQLRSEDLIDVAIGRDELCAARHALAGL